MKSFRVARLAKTLLIILGVFLLVVLLYAASVYRNLKLQSAAADRVAAELEVGYQAQLAEYRCAMRIGTPRSEVREYLNSKRIVYIVYNDRDGEIRVNLGREASVLPCDYWTTYLSFEFGHAQSQAEPSSPDALSAISLKRIGHCL